MFCLCPLSDLEQLKSILAQDPKNTFARYALGMEYSSAGETDSAMQEFRTLLEAGRQTMRMPSSWGRRRCSTPSASRKPIQWLRDGIACAHRVGNRHAESEMQTLLEELES